jgi:hypothetical protein
MVPRRVPPVVGAALLLGLVFAVLFSPVLAGRATFVQGDALSVGLPLQHVLADALSRGELPLWSNEIYGGHPVFAEGQGGFAHPLNWLLFGVLPTLYAHGLLHVLCVWIAALGTFALCRELGLGAMASTLAALALACSQDWLVLTGNSAIALASAFVPVALWTVERWWRQPDVGRALTLATAITAVALAGYPQALHAASLMALVTLLVRTDRAWWRAPWRHVGTGLLAVGVALGLSAIQLLPTFELVRESVRAEGVGLVTSVDPILALRGLLFTIGRRAEVEPGLGSLLVLGLALLGLSRGRTVVAWALGSLFLLQLSLADASPLYRLLHHAVPGLDSFRITHLYETIALVGVAVLAGYGVDRLAETARPERGWLAWAGSVTVLLGVACYALHDGEVRIVGYAFPVIALAAVGVLIARGLAARWVPISLVTLLLLEILVMRMPLHRFVDAEVVREPPPTVRFLLERHPDRRDFKIANVPHFFSYIGFSSPSTPGLSRLAGLFLSSMDAGSNLLWGIPSVNANLALPLLRRVAVSDLIVADVRGESARALGARFVDVTGVRYVVAHNQHRKHPYGESLEEVFYDDDYRFFALENPFSRGRLQLYAPADVRWVPDMRAAVAEFSREGRSLVLEGTPPVAVADLAEVGGTRATIVVADSQAERHVVVVEARDPVWLVVADAPYPGWRASVDGEPVPVHPANVLGKAVAVPAGTHRVELVFTSESFARGRVISGVTALGVLITLGATLAAARRSAAT